MRVVTAREREQHGVLLRGRQARHPPGHVLQSINTGNGFSGGLQFTPQTWRAFGGTGQAHQASREEQVAVAERVLAAQGWGAWPVCSRKLGLH